MKNVKEKKTKSVTHFYHGSSSGSSELKNTITDYRISTRDIDSIVYLSGRIKTYVPYLKKITWVKSELPFQIQVITTCDSQVRKLTKLISPSRGLKIAKLI